MSRFLDDPRMFAHLVVCAFFAVCFLQSGIDKVVDWKGNLAWLTGHFEKSPLKNAVALLLSILTALEIATGVVALIAVGALIVGPSQIGKYALMMSCLTLLALFTGQRVAKDYAGAQTIAVYFGVAVLGLLAH